MALTKGHMCDHSKDEIQIVCVEYLKSPPSTQIRKKNTTSVISNQIDFASSQDSAYAPKRILFPL
jgi:hypothetical protein